jgi:hypothetical protein
MQVSKEQARLILWALDSLYYSREANGYKNALKILQDMVKLELDREVR